LSGDDAERHLDGDDLATNVCVEDAPGRDVRGHLHHV